MRATIAILGVVVLFSGRASGQLTYLSANRSVSAEAETRRADFPEPNQNYYDFDNPTTSSDDLLPFIATVTAESEFWETHATAWQDSRLFEDRIIVDAGIRDLNHLSFAANGYARATAEFETQFSLFQPSWVSLSNDIFLANIGVPPFEVTNTARVAYSLTGPNIQVEYDVNVFQFQPTEDVPFRQFLDELLIPPGAYMLIASIDSRTQGDDRNIDVHFELQLDVFPIPEPPCLSFLFVTTAISGSVLARAVRSKRLRLHRRQLL